MFILTIIILPIILSFLPLPKMKNIKRLVEGEKFKAAENLNEWSRSHPRSVLLITSIVFILSIVGLYKVNYNISILDDLKPGNKLFDNINDPLCGLKCFKNPVPPRGLYTMSKPTQFESMSGLGKSPNMFTGAVFTMRLAECIFFGSSFIGCGSRSQLKNLELLSIRVFFRFLILSNVLLKTNTRLYPIEINEWIMAFAAPP